MTKLAAVEICITQSFFVSLVICVPVSVFRDDNKEDIFVHQVESMIIFL